MSEEREFLSPGTAVRNGFVGRFFGVGQRRMIPTQHEPQEFPDLSVAVWEAIHARVAVFEDAWRRTAHSDSAHPRIDEFLGPDDPSGGQLLVELIHSDLHFRLTAGEAVPIEKYLATYPALAAQPDAVAGLIAAEYRFRRRREPEDAASASRRRFPGLAGPVTALLGGDDTLPLDGNGHHQHDPDGKGRSTTAVEPLPSVAGYELIEEIGRGGMGVVYKAIETRLKRTVALKTLRPGADASERERLKREAEAAAALAHPHVVPVYAVFEEGPRLFVASEYVAGGTLADRTIGEPLSPRAATTLIEPIARAVAHAHAVGIVHRDLKPSNVLLTSDGSPKVTDFGLAKREGDDSDLTRTGVIAGSPSYMAPEQTIGTKDVGPAADVWQLGAILYELLTGRPPFRAATTLETLDLVRSSDPVPPRRLVPRLPRDLETVCLKCLEKEPSNRYASAEALANDLARFRRGESVLARPVGLAGRTFRWAIRHRSQAALVATLAVAVLFGMTSLAIYTTQLDRLNDRLGETIQDRDDALAAQTAARQQAVTSDRYSRRLLFASDMRLTAEAIREGDLVRAAELLEAHESDATGEYAFVRNALERMVHCPGGKIDHLGGPAYFVCLSPDGRTLAACGAPGEIRLYETGTWKPKAHWQAGQGELNGLAFHPDGRLLVSAGDDGTVAAWDLDTQTERWRTKVFDTPAYQVVFGLGGSVLAVAGSSPEIVLLDATTAKERQRLPADSGSTDDGSVESIAVTPDGQTLLAATWASGAIAWDLATGTQRWAQRTVTPAGFPHEHLSVSVSADGRFAAFGRKEPEFLVTDVASGRVIHDGLLPIRTATGDGAWCRSVAFLANSHTLAVANDAGVVHLVTVAEDGLTLAAPRSSWLAGQERISGLVATSDGTLLTAARDGTLVAWRPSDEPPWRESPFPGGEKIVWIAPSADRPQSERLFQAGGIAGAGVAQVIDLADRTRHELPGHDQVHWAYVITSADGRRLIASGTTKELYGWDTATDPPSLLFRRRFEDVAPDFRYAYLGTATRDGRLAVGSVERPTGEELVLFDGTSGKSLVTRLFPPEVYEQSAISEDGTVVLFTHGTRLLLLDPETLATRRELRGHAEKIIAVALSPDGRRIATADNDREIIVWETVSGRILRRWQAGPGEIRSLAFSRSGGLFLSATDRQPPRLWDLATGRLLLEPGAISIPTGLLALAPATFTPDGGRLLVAGRENVLILDGRRMNRRAFDQPASPARR